MEPIKLEKPEKWDKSVIIIREASATSESAILDHFMHDYGTMLRKDNKTVEVQVQKVVNPKPLVFTMPDIKKIKFYIPGPKGSALLDPTRSEPPNRKIVKVVNRKKQSVPEIKKEPGSEEAEPKSFDLKLPLECKCERIFQTIDEFMRHLLKEIDAAHMSKVPFRGQHCLKNYSEFQEPKKIKDEPKIKQEKEELKFPLIKISEVTSLNPAYQKIEEMRKNEPTVCDNATYICRYCNYWFPSEETWDNHLALYHRSNNPITMTCRYCQEPFTNHQKLNFHHKHVHPNDRDLTCFLCSRQFQYYIEYFQHLAQHKDFYICHMCGYFFTNKSEYSTHYFKLHVFDYPCVCGRIMLQQKTLNSHRKKCKIYQDSIQ